MKNTILFLALVILPAIQFTAASQGTTQNKAAVWEFTLSDMQHAEAQIIDAETRAEKAEAEAAKWRAAAYKLREEITQGDRDLKAKVDELSGIMKERDSIQDERAKISEELGSLKEKKPRPFGLSLVLGVGPRFVSQNGAVNVKATVIGGVGITYTPDFLRF